jgi:hypothetical protein
VSDKNPRRAGASAFPEKKPGLRLVKSPEERPHPKPDPELKAIFKDLNRRFRAQRERGEREPDGKDAA